MSALKQVELRIMNQHSEEWVWGGVLSSQQLEAIPSILDMFSDAAIASQRRVTTATSPDPEASNE